jgi:hypothetical protein
VAARQLALARAKAAEVGYPRPMTWGLAKRRAAATLLALAGLAACDGAYLPVDPPVSLADAGPRASGPPHAEVGLYVSDRYQALAPGSPLPVVNGLQGGMWTMPVIRITGMGSFGTVDCALVMASGEQVGATRTKTKFFPAPGGAYEALNFPIPVFHPEREGAPIDDLFGQTATLTCSVEDASGAQAGFSIALELVAG